jgi:hypothetical protein
LSIERPDDLARLRATGRVVAITLREVSRLVATRDGSVAAHVEHTVPIASGPPLVLTA